MARVYTQEEIQYAIDNYEKKTSTQIAKDLNTYRGWVTALWKRKGLKGKGIGRQYYSDFNYFSSIDTENKAYIVGFIAADGCLYKRDGHQGLVQITIKEDDIEILEKILKDMKSNNPINKGETKTTRTATISLISDQMYNNLCKIGLMDNKTWAMDIRILLSNIPSKFHGDFFRGYFDGDGSITIPISRENALQQWGSEIVPSIVAPWEEIKHMQEFFDNIGIKSLCTKDNRDNYPNSFGTISFNNATSKYCFLKYMYKSIEEDKSNLFLPRKYNRAKILFDIVENNKTNRSENIEAIEFYKQNFN